MRPLGLRTAVAVQRTLFDALPVGLAQLAPERVVLDADCWVDVQRAWLVGADTVLERVVETLPWQSGRRPMYDRMVDVPRLTAFLPTADGRFPAIVRQMAGALGPRFRADFRLVGANLYRSGRDSVAWHRDRIGRVERNPVIGIVSLGGPRRFVLRPMGGGRSVRFDLGSGDLLVMGGATQHRWEHAVPKVASAAPRVSLTFRHGSERLQRGFESPRTIDAPTVWARGIESIGPASGATGRIDAEWVPEAHFAGRPGAD